jgi:glutamine amidotransferase
VIALVDYGAGNLASVRKGFDAAGAALFAPGSPVDLRRARGIVVPGVGHFDATRSLAGGWFEEIASRVQAGVPIFGICLGMQWLFEGSDEAVDVRGLGALRGTVRRLAASPSCKVPHVGWNTLEARDAAGILEGVEDASYVYFSHAFAAPVTPDCVAATTHGPSTFAAVAQREHVCGVQFHPEKSGPAGIRILRNFAALTDR